MIDVKWDRSLAGDLPWPRPITNLAAKQEVADRIALEVRDGDVVGFGSGSTSYLAIQAIARRLEERGIRCTAIPTSTEVAFTCAALGIPTASLIEAKPDWVFDGADEVDPQHNLIKGRGGAMFREKLLIDSSPKTFILVDPSKLVSRLGEKHPVPIELFPESVNLVTRELYRLGATELELRLAVKKDGPVITENGNLIVDAKFAEINSELERGIKAIPGVIESGLFIGRSFEVLVSSTSPR